MALKFIRLFEDFKEQKIETWSQVRDAIQMKRPFVIIVFRTNDSYKEAIDSEFSDIEFIKQTAFMSKDGNIIQYPSIFFILDRDKNIENDIKKYYEEFDVIQTITGKASSEFSTVYFSDGTSSDFGNEIVSSIAVDDIDDGDYFRVGSMYYRFIEFHG